ncbi:MAG: FecR domain-containing protein [Proteobacteria bacterium]|nr:FecR domain-containing protein [Pseudomonadota bacterium]
MTIDKKSPNSEMENGFGPEIWEYAPPKPRTDLVARVMKSIAVEQRQKTRGSGDSPALFRFYAAAALLVFICGILFIAAMRPGPIEGVFKTGRHQKLKLGDRASAIMGDEAGISYRINKPYWFMEGDTNITQDSGVVRYKVEKGGPFEVETPGCLVRVTGTEFAVEVGRMKKKTTPVLLGTAAVVTAVAVYAGSVVMENEHGSLALKPGQRGQATLNETPKLADQSPKEREAREKKGTNRSEKRRFKNRTDRKRLVAAIKAAKRQRLMQRVAQDGENTESQPSDTVDYKANEDLSKEIISDAVDEIIPEIENCYEKVLENDETLEGRIVVNFKIIGEPDVGGVIEDAKIVKEDSEGSLANGSLANNEDLSHCLLDSMDLIELPAPENGGQAIVTYPFMFTPPGAD